MPEWFGFLVETSWTLPYFLFRAVSLAILVPLSFYPGLGVLGSIDLSRFPYWSPKWFVLFAVSLLGVVWPMLLALAYDPNIRSCDLEMLMVGRTWGPDDCIGYPTF